MALHGTNTEVKVEQGTGVGVNPNTQQPTQDQVNPQVQQQAQQVQQTAQQVQNSVMGFENNDLGLIGQSTSSEQCNRISKVITEEIRKRAVNTTVRIDILDNEVVTNLAYSSIIISDKMPDGNVYFYPILIPVTGRQAKTAGEFINEYTQANVRAAQFGGNRQKPDVFTYDQALDSVYGQAIQNLLTTIYGANVTFFAVSGAVLPYNIADDELLSISISAGNSAYNALRLINQQQSGKKDLNLEVARRRLQNGKFTITKGFSRQACKNAFSQPQRADWELILELKNDTQYVESLNSSASMQRILGVRGFVDAIPEYRVNNINGIPTQQVRLHPHIIINAVNINVSNQTPPTLGFLLTGILTSLAMLNKTMWPAPLIRNIDNVIALNKIVNLANEPGNVGSVMPITKKTTEQEIKKFIFDSFSLVPVLSVDVDSYGPQSYYMDVLAAATNPEDPTLRLGAARHIIETAVQLTNGLFPHDFNPELIFQNTGVKVPTGVWASGKGEHDIKDIDLAFVCAKSQDPNSAVRWANSNFTKDKINADPFGLKVEGIAELVPDAVVSGSAIRVTFNPAFILTLASAAKGCGLVLDYEPEVTVDSGLVNWSGMTNTFAGIDPTGTSGLAREQQGMTPTTFYSPFTTMGQMGYYK